MSAVENLHGRIEGYRQQLFRWASNFGGIVPCGAITENESQLHIAIIAGFDGHVKGIPPPIDRKRIGRG
jgi:hypothetical protein